MYLPTIQSDLITYSITVDRKRRSRFRGIKPLYLSNTDKHEVELLFSRPEPEEVSKYRFTARVGTYIDIIHDVSLRFAKMRYDFRLS